MVRQRDKIGILFGKHGISHRSGRRFDTQFSGFHLHARRRKAHAQPLCIIAAELLPIFGGGIQPVVHMHGGQIGQAKGIAQGGQHVQQHHGIRAAAQSDTNAFAAQIGNLRGKSLQELVGILGWHGGLAVGETAVRAATEAWVWRQDAMKTVRRRCWAIKKQPALWLS